MAVDEDFERAATGAGERPEAKEEQLVTLVSAAAADQKDVTYLTEAGSIRFIEGRAREVPLSVAHKIAEGRRGWLIEPVVYVRTPREP